MPLLVYYFCLKLLIPWTLVTGKTLQELLYRPDTLGYEKSLTYSSLVNSFNTAPLRKNWSELLYRVFLLSILHLKLAFW